VTGVGTRARSFTANRGHVVVVVLIVLALLYPQIVGSLASIPVIGDFVPATDSMVVMIAFTTMAVGLNMVVGYAGLLDLGYVAFYAVGAYTAGWFASQQFDQVSWQLGAVGIPDDLPGIHLSMWLVLPIAGLLTLLAGIAIGLPTLRLRGDYLAIVTLGFGEIVPLVIKNVPEVTKGTQGMNPIGYPEIPGLQFAVDPIPWYYLIVAVLMLSVLITARLRTSRVGRAWAAMREDEVAAASMGVNLVTTKLFAFSLGASFSGFAGSIWASYLQVIAPEQFDFSVSIFVLCMIILGGLGNIGGVIAGGLMLGFVDRVLFDWISGLVHGIGEAIGNQDLRLMDVSRSRQLIFGVALVVMMLVRPEGLFPSARVRAELHAAEEDEGAVTQERAQLVDVER
jgi:branched-chain amino acid transport system permease protein